MVKFWPFLCSKHSGFVFKYFTKKQTSLLLQEILEQREKFPPSSFLGKILLSMLKMKREKMDFFLNFMYFFSNNPGYSPPEPDATFEYLRPCDFLALNYYYLGNFEILPEEIVLKILGYLDLISLLQVIIKVFI